MSTTVPCIKGQMGKIEFYQTKMRAAHLATVARPPIEMDGWADFSIEERLQRELNDKRVRDEIIPYLAKSDDRFFGSILVLVYEPDTFEYEEASQFLSKVPSAYRSVIGQMGCLTIDGGQLIVLDGQHRLAALRAAVQGRDDKGHSIDGPYATAIRNDELSVVFIPWYDAETTRRIFNKINKNAKPTSRGDNIITSEDDGYAIIARMLLRPDGPLGFKNPTVKKGQEPLLVNWKSNTLADRSGQFTTISAVYETLKDILKHHNIVFNEKEEVVRPDDHAVEDAYEQAADWWSAVLDGVDCFRTVRQVPDQVAGMRAAMPQWGLLLKPGPHIVLFRGLIMAVERGVDRDTAIKRLNEVDWNITSDVWQSILIGGNGRIFARKENYDISAEMLAYLIGADALDDDAKDKLRKKIAAHRSTDLDVQADYQLPTPIS